MSPLSTHLTIAARTLHRRPGLFAGRAITVALVVAAFSAVFTVANVTFLRPLPFPDSQRLVRVYMQPPGTTDFDDINPLQPVMFVYARDHVKLLDRFEGIWAADRAVTGDGEPESVPAGRVSAGFFALLGGAPAVGRTFSEEDVEGRARVAVVSHGFWMRRFGGDPSAVGKALTLDGETFTIVGVMNQGFEPAYAPSEIWTPLDIRNGAEKLSLSSVQSIGHLGPGVSAKQAQAELESIRVRAMEVAPGLLRGWTPGVIELRRAHFGSQRPVILMLLAAAIGLALIAIANLANLTLADVLSRRSDFAIRAALGGSRIDLAAPEIAQSLVIAGTGGIAGVLVSAWTMPIVLALDSSTPLAHQPAPTDWRVVGAGLAVATAVMLCSIAAPVLRLLGQGAAGDLTTGARRAIGSTGATRVRRLLVTAQTALALVLLSTGALIVSTYERSLAIDPGFDPSRVITAQIRVSGTALPTEHDRGVYVEHLLDRIREAPGVVEAGTTLNRFQAGNAFQTVVQIEDQPRQDGQGYTVQYRRISPGYFEAMRIRLVQGRTFARSDNTDHPPVAIVSRSFAHHFWGDHDPVGRRIKRGATAAVWSIIVGVVDDVRDVAMDQAPRETVYSPYYQGSNPAAPVALVVRTAGDPRASIGAIERAVWDIDPTQPLFNVVTVEEFLGATLGPQRLRALLITVCGALGLLLATIGVYGVTARAVVERQREVGIRLALGGTHREVWWTMAWGSGRAVLAGAVAGTVASVLAIATLRAVVPGLDGAGWFVTAAASMTLLAAGTLTAAWAAHAAVSVDPLTALRPE